LIAFFSRFQRICSRRAGSPRTRDRWAADVAGGGETFVLRRRARVERAAREVLDELGARSGKHVGHAQRDGRPIEERTAELAQLGADARIDVGGRVVDDVGDVTKLDHAEIAQQRDGELGNPLYDGRGRGQRAQRLPGAIQEIEHDFRAPAFGDVDENAHHVERIGAGDGADDLNDDGVNQARNAKGQIGGFMIRILGQPSASGALWVCIFGRQPRRTLRAMTVRWISLVPS
jgi:hypothetical protein